MKTLNYYQYINLFEGLLEFLNRKDNVCDWIFEQLNGRKFGCKSESGNHEKPILTMSQIRQIWENEHIRKGLTKLLIINHYVGCQVGLSKHTSALILKDNVRRYSTSLTKKLKLYSSSENTNIIC